MPLRDHGSMAMLHDALCGRLWLLPAHAHGTGAEPAALSCCAVGTLYRRTPWDCTAVPVRCSNLRVKRCSDDMLHQCSKAKKVA